MFSWRPWQHKRKMACASHRVCGVTVVRPDSGDPATIVVEVLEALGAKSPCPRNLGSTDRITGMVIATRSRL